jgi:hypothetical protein
MTVSLRNTLLTVMLVLALMAALMIGLAKVAGNGSDSNSSLSHSLIVDNSGVGDLFT